MDFAMRICALHTGKWKLQDMFPNLAARADTAAGVLSGGEKQMLTICRTLMGDPELVMIGEPTEGLAPNIVQQVATRSPKSPAAASPSCWSNRSCRSQCGSRTAFTSWDTAGSCSKAPRPNSRPTRRCARNGWGCEGCRLAGLPRPACGER
jgi:hypothetical protein